MDKYVIRVGTELYLSTFEMVSPSLSAPCCVLLDDAQRFDFRLADEFARRLKAAGYAAKVVACCD